VNQETPNSTAGSGLAQNELRLLRAAELMYQANQRVGTAKTKTRVEVAGASRKLYKQKGTGRARAGNRRTPVRVGGGHAFAKRPREWRYALPKKMRRAALRVAIGAQVQAGLITLVDLPQFEKPSTKQLVAWAKSNGANGRTLIITAELARNVVLSARNVPELSVITRGDLNAHEMLVPKSILVDRSLAAEFGKA